MAAENIKTWQIGEVDVVRIVEINDHHDPFTMLGPDFTLDVAKRNKWLVPHFAEPDGTMKISFQCFIVRSGKERIMIDTCIGNDRQREYEVFSNLQSPFLDDLVSAGCPRETITKVLCTHLHQDHVGWNTMKVDGRFVPTFPNARYLFGKKEHEHCLELKRSGHHDVRHFEDSVEPITKAGLADFIEPTLDLTADVRLIPTHGHTPGHVSVMIRSKGQEAIITGDMMHHPIQLSEPDFPNNFDMDPGEALKTRKEMYGRLADTDILVIGTHFCDPTSGYIVRDGKRWKLKLDP